MKNLQNLAKEIDIQTKEAQSPKQVKPKEATQRHIIIKIQRLRQRENLKSNQRKAVSYLQGGAPMRVSVDFSTGTLKTIRGWQEIFKMMKSKDLQPRLLYPAKLSFRIKGQIKII